MIDIKKIIVVRQKGRCRYQSHGIRRALAPRNWGFFYAKKESGLR
jgi:hypothetical protein